MTLLKCILQPIEQSSRFCWNSEFPMPGYLRWSLCRAESSMWSWQSWNGWKLKQDATGIEVETSGFLIRSLWLDQAKNCSNRPTRTLWQRESSCWFQNSWSGRTLDTSDSPVCATPGIYSDASRKKTGPRMRMKFRISQSLCFEAKATVLLAFWIAVTLLLLSRGSTRVCFPRRSDLDEGSMERRERRERCGMSFYCRVAFSRGSTAATWRNLDPRAPNELYRSWWPGGSFSLLIVDFVTITSRMVQKNSSTMTYDTE